MPKANARRVGSHEKLPAFDAQAFSPRRARHAAWRRMQKAQSSSRKVNQATPLAEMVGTTRSRVNFFMNKFRDLGFIEYNGDLKVNTSLLSVVLHD